MNLAEYFGTSPEQIQQMHQGLKARAAELGLPLDPSPKLVNTHGALMLAEYARDQGKADEVHSLLFKAYFAQGRNLAEEAVLREVAQSAGLDPDEAMGALTNPVYEERISNAKLEAQTYGITGAPTFIINDRYKIVGAQPYDRLLGAFRQIQAQG